MIELTVENLEKIKRLSDKYRGFWRLEFTFLDLLDLFGPKLWNRELLFADEIKTVPGTMHLGEVERQLIYNALEQADYRQNVAAKMLGISPRKLSYKIKKLNIRHSNWKTNKPEVCNE